MARKFKPISAVPFELLKKGHEEVISERETNGRRADFRISLVKALRKCT